jgi:cytochrome b
MKKISILVWDLLTRIFHWTLAGSFLLAYLSGGSE